MSYVDYSSAFTFAKYPERYGYSAFYNKAKLAKVTIGEQCTAIPAYLFYNNSSITLISFPHIRNIGQRAFYNCSKLTTLNLGDALEVIDNAAFYGCSNLTKLTLPNTAKRIGDSAFYNCSSVAEVTVGSQLESIGSSAFFGCKSFTALVLPDCFKTMGTSAFEGCTKLTVAKLGESLTAVPAKAFKDCPALSEMVVPASAQSIGEQAFYNDSGLATVTMNEGLKAIGDQAFYNASGLVTITMKEGLKTIGNEVFWNNSGVIRFSIPGTVTSIGQNCFYGCTNVSYLIFRDGDGDLTIDNNNCRSSIIEAKTTDVNIRNRYYDYFYDCPIRFLTLGRNLKYSYATNQSIWDVVNNKWTSINRASGPFVNKTELRSVTIGPKVNYLYHHLLNGCSNVAKLTFVPALTDVYSYALANCTGLKDLDLSTGLQTVGDYGFYNCPKLTALTFPNWFRSLGRFGCANNMALKNVVFNEESGNNIDMTLGEYAFANCPAITSLVFPAKTNSVGNYCFYNTPYITDVTFVDSNKAVTLGYGAKADSSMGITSDAEMPLFGNSRLQKLYMGRNIAYVFNSDENSTEQGKYGYSPFYSQSFLTDVKFSQAGTVTYCNPFLLYKVDNCKELKLPESLTVIGRYAFAGMTVLNGITIPNKVTKMQKYAFYADDGLKYANLSKNCAWLQKGTFNHCDSLESITIPPVVTKMDPYLFAYCKSLSTVTFEGGADLIEMGYGASDAGYGMFRDCPVETLNLDRWLSYNTDSSVRAPFYGIPTLKKINIGENVKVIDKYMFMDCTGLEDIYLPDNIESVGLSGFHGCTSLKNVRFSQKLSQISDFGFARCTSLDNVVFPASMTSIAGSSFYNCTSLKKLDLGNNLNIIGPAAFKNDSALEGIEIPETLYGLGVEAFANCTSLPHVAIKAISSVGKQAFQGCTGLKWVSLSDKTTSLGENAFAGCTGINYIKSFAEFPPEGLVNFPADVVANGTLFVPEYSVDYYQYSPTWENWNSIRPINDNVMVTSVSLDKSEVIFKATEAVQLTASAGEEDATDKSIIWDSSNDQVAIVDNKGLVTAVSVGEATITALAADGSGNKATCQVRVLPTMVESIAINSDVNTLKKGRTLELGATVAPATATNSTYTWSTSNAAVATVTADGVVKAVAAGNVEITARANDGSGVYSSFALTIVPPAKGDSNDNDIVTISDAVNTANYAVGNKVENFCFEAADVNSDNRVTLSDASATVAIVLDQPVQATTMAKVCALASAKNDELDKVVIDDYSAGTGETTSVFVALDNTRDYVALQADVNVPKGMTLEAVKIGYRAEANHSLAAKRIDGRSMRIALFDINNSIFSDNDEAILELIVKVNGTTTDRIELNNILASDAQANEYALASTGGKNANMSGIDSAGGTTVGIEATEDGINIYKAAGCEIAIYAVDGTTIAHFVAASDYESRKVVPGVYIVAAGARVEKVMVK